MSRIGKLPVIIPENLKFTLADKKIEIVDGNKKLSLEIPFGVTVKNEGNVLEISRVSDDKRYRALHGTVRALINNMVIGLTKGFTKRLELRGVGYKAQIKGNLLVLNLGFSHPVDYKIPEGIQISVEGNTKVVINGYNKQLVGQTAAEIRKYRKPEPYKGKGVRYEDEFVMMKAGKRSK